MSLCAQRIKVQIAITKMNMPTITPPLNFLQPTWIHGPIISTSDLSEHERLFTTFGMQRIAQQFSDEEECSLAWGTPLGTTVTELVLATQDTRYGARVLQFSPVSDTVIRDRSRGMDANAPKVIDFYTPNFQAACEAVRSAGFSIRDPIAEYDLPEGHMLEAHVWGPDEIVCALLAGPSEFFKNFASVTDRLFSEPQSLSGAVSDFDSSVDFFTSVFGLEVVYRYGLDDDSFRQMLGSARPEFNLRAINIGSSTREPYIGLIHYGMPQESYRSLAGLARPPHRGTLGATLFVKNVDVAVAAARALSAPILAEPAEIETAAWGFCRAALLQAPNGGCYQILSTA